MSWNRNENNMRQEEELEEAKQKQQQSEWVLNILRCQTGTPNPRATNEELLLWNQHLNLNPK
jgi:hypothetical protein